MGYKYCLTAKKPVNKWLYEEWTSKKSALKLQWHSRHKLQWDTCPIWHNLLNDCGSRKVFICYDYMCIVAFVRILKGLSHDPRFTSKVLKADFLWKTHSLDSDYFCNLSVFVGTNGKDKKNNIKNCLVTDWSFLLLIAAFLLRFLTWCYFYPISVNPCFF